jgi:hypothetical protein
LLRKTGDWVITRENVSEIAYLQHYVRKFGDAIAAREQVETARVDK